MSLAHRILKELWETTLYYKGVKVNLFGIPIFSDQKYTSLRSTVYRLRKNNLIDKNDEGWFLTPSGKRYFEEIIVFKNFNNPFERKSPKNLLLMFDIPVSKNSHRDWLRRQLKEFDYLMIQRSVWVGPSPLPKEFLEYMKSIGLKDKIKTFKLAKPYRD